VRGPQRRVAIVAYLQSWVLLGLALASAGVGPVACGETPSRVSSTAMGGGGMASAFSTYAFPTYDATPAPGSGGGNCGGLPSLFTMPSCGACVTKSCCSEAKACDTGSACQNLLFCEQQGQMTMAQCEATYANGVKPLRALNKCISGNCATEDTCGVMCTGNTIDYSDPSLAMCNQCINGMCCSEFTQLTTDIGMSTDPNCMTGGDMTMCPPFQDLSTCEQTPTDPVCATDTDAAAAADCENTMCGDTCPQFICNSGIEQTGMGAGTCTACLTMNCCTEFSDSMCSDQTQMAACMTWLTDFNHCSMDMGMCNGDASAQAAYMCQTTNCASPCGM
jgi:hypothetical protein